MVNHYTTVRITNESSNRLDDIIEDIEDKELIDISKSNALDIIIQEIDSDDVREMIRNRLD